MNHQLHAAAFIEKSFRNYGALRWHRSQHCPTLQNIFDDLLRAGIIYAAFFLEPRDSLRNFRQALPPAHRRDVVQTVAHFLPQRRDLQRQFLRARGSFATPEGNSRRSAMRILHQHASGLALHAPDSPRSVS